MSAAAEAGRARDRGVAGVHRDHQAAGTLSLVRQDSQELPPARVEDAAVEPGLRGGTVRQEDAGLLGVGPGLGLGILSNSFAGAREREEAAYGFGALVDRIVYSHEIGVLKPDPRAYEAVCAAMGARPGGCLFVDDAPENVEAAREFGMWARLHEDNARTIARITAYAGPGA
ncbi:HAD-IA family hydrolase [Streptomyces atacamensis]|uniref:HAD-IA family hydrolase n=1 Tax=Streptomyces atacamensis TaxID=531966 RepID=UPI00399D45F2